MKTDLILFDGETFGSEICEFVEGGMSRFRDNLTELKVRHPEARRIVVLRDFFFPLFEGHVETGWSAIAESVATNEGWEVIRWDGTPPLNGIASLCGAVVQHARSVVIYTGNKRALGLLSPIVRVRLRRTGKATFQEFSEESFAKKFGFKPEYYWRYVAMIGHGEGLYRGFIDASQATRFLKEFENNIQNQDTLFPYVLGLDEDQAVEFRRCLALSRPELDLERAKRFLGNERDLK